MQNLNFIQHSSIISNLLKYFFFILYMILTHWWCLFRDSRHFFIPKSFVWPKNIPCKCIKCRVSGFSQKSFWRKDAKLYREKVIHENQLIRDKIFTKCQNTKLNGLFTNFSREWRSYVSGAQLNIQHTLHQRIREQSL